MNQEINLSVFNYDNTKNFLKDVYKQKKNKNPMYSIKAWANKMKFSHPSSLEYLLNGRRKIRPNHIRYLLRGLKLSLAEKNYFTELVYLENCKNNSEKPIHLENMKRITEYYYSGSIEDDSFALCSSWYYFTILAMTHLKGFKDDPNWISKRLEKKVAPVEVKTAIDRLLRLGLLKRQNNKLVATSKCLFKISKEWQSEGVKKQTKQILDLAQKKVGKSPKDIFINTTMTINTSKLKEANALLMEYKSQLAELMEEENGDETYILGIQYFKIT